MSDKDSKFTYDNLTEIMRTEDNSSDLYELKEDFYPSVDALIKESIENRKKAIAENPDLYDGLNTRIKNIDVVVEKILYMRMNKIWKIAMRNVLSGNDSVPFGLTPEEKIVYAGIYDICKKHFGIVRMDKKVFVPDIETVTQTSKGEPVAEEKPIPEEETPLELGVPQPKEPEPIPEIEDGTTVEGETVVIRVLEDIPPFSGPERDYFLKKEDVVRLPSIMATGLINRRKAVLIKTSV